MADFNINLTAQPIALRTGAAIAFDRPAVYNTAAAPSNATVTLDLSGAVPGTEVVGYFNHASQPVWPSGIVAVGVWTNGGLNVVRFVYINSGAISAVIGSDYNLTGTNLWRTIQKPTSEDRFSTTTVAADSELRFPVEASTNYVVRGWIYGDHQSTMGLKYNFGVPTGTSGIRVLTTNRSVATAPANAWSNAALADQSFTGNTGANIHSIEFDFRFTTGVNSGEWAFLWSQVNSNASNRARINIGSYIEWLKLG
jgi:hypothetical protein